MKNINFSSLTSLRRTGLIDALFKNRLKIINLSWTWNNLLKFIFLFIFKKKNTLLLIQVDKNIVLASTIWGCYFASSKNFANKLSG